MMSFMNFFSALFLSVLSSIFNPADDSFSRREVPPGTPKVEFSCSEVRWVNGGMEGKNFIGTVEVVCNFKAVHGGGFTELNRYMIDQAVHGEAIKTVHGGPTSEKYEGMPSTYFDVTAMLGKGSDVAYIRQDMHIATDLAKRLVFSTISKSVDGQGNAKYLKKSDVWADIRSTNVTMAYSVSVRGHAVVEKPWFLPSDTFENLIRDQVKKQAEDFEKQIITEVAQHL